MAKMRGWLLLGFVVVVLIAFQGAIERLADALLYAPWAYGWDSRGDLTDEWTGRLPDGRDLDIALVRELGADGLPVPADDSDATMIGAGRMCEGRETIERFSVAARSNRSGSRVRLTLAQPTGTRASLNGRWSGDLLEVSGDSLGPTGRGGPATWPVLRGGGAMNGHPSLASAPSCRSGIRAAGAAWCPPADTRLVPCR